MIHKTVLLDCAQRAAFELFTQRISDWWPAERKHTKDPASRLFLEVSGRFYERASDGREVELGRVVAWEAPSRLVLDFYPGTDAAHPTQVEVSFREQGERTLVSVAHGPKPESEALWNGRFANYERSWDVVLPALAKAVGSA